MPVNTGDNNGNDQGQKGRTQGSLADAFESANQQQTPQTPPPRQPRRQGSFLDINSRFRRPATRAATGEAVQNYVKALNKEFETTIGSNYRDLFKIQVFDNNTNAVPLSVILVCLQVQSASKEKHVFTYSLLVEASRSRLAPRVLTINNQPVEIDTVPGDFADQTLWAKIETFMQETYGVDNLKLHNAGSMVLPTELSAEDAEHLRRIVYNVSQALYTMMEVSGVGAGEQPISIGDFSAGANLAAILDYNPGHGDSAAGIPIRSDLSIILRATKAGVNQQNQDLNTGVLDVTRADGYVDLAYSDPPAPQGPYQQPVTQRYYPRFIITRLDSQIDAITPELQLAALSTATMLAKGSQWATAFQPRYGNSKELNLRDIGAVGYEVSFSANPQDKPAGKIDTASSDFDKQQWWQLVSMAIHDRLSYSMDIEENGELSWLHSTFLAAARGDQRAYDAIVKAADGLTEGNFSPLWNGAPICEDDNNRIALGYFIGADGEKHDLREIDYLAMLNIAGATDMPMVVKWSESFQRTDIPDALRLETRNKFLKNWNKTTEIKGYAQRINFTSDFVECLAAACANAGLNIRQTNVLMDTIGGGQRAGFNPDRYAVNAQHTGNLFSYGQPTYGNYRGFTGGVYGRWGGQ